MAQNSSQIDSIRHSLAHLLAAAVLKKFPGTKLGIGPVIENGFYYDFKFPKNRAASENDLSELENLMRRLIAQELPFSGKKITPVAAKKLFKDQPFKLDLIKEFAKDKKPLAVYATGDVFQDLCRGGHVKILAKSTRALSSSPMSRAPTGVAMKKIPSFCASTA